MSNSERRTIYRRWADPSFREKMNARRATFDTRAAVARRRPTRVWWHNGDLETLATTPPGEDWKRGRRRKAQVTLHPLRNNRTLRGFSNKGEFHAHNKRRGLPLVIKTSLE
jgi:hypothetical protein